MSSYGIMLTKVPSVRISGKPIFTSKRLENDGDAERVFNKLKRKNIKPRYFIVTDNPANDIEHPVYEFARARVSAYTPVVFVDAYLGDSDKFPLIGYVKKEKGRWNFVEKGENVNG